MEISDAQLVLEMVKEKMAKAVEYLDNELATYRVGKANPAIFSGVTVEYYGTPTPLAQVSVFLFGCPDYDYSALGENTHSSHRKSHYGCQSGLHPSEQREVIRILVPPLTEERRKNW